MSGLDGLWERCAPWGLCCVWPTGQTCVQSVLSSQSDLGHPLHIPSLPSWPPLRPRPGCPAAASPAPCGRASLRSGSGSRSPHWGGGRRDRVTRGAARHQCTASQGQVAHKQPRHLPPDSAQSVVPVALQVSLRKTLAVSCPPGSSAHPGLPPPTPLCWASF